MEQMTNSMRALQLALGHSRWRCGFDPKDPRILQARAPGRGYHNSLKFAFEGDQIDLDESVVRVVDDARSYAPGQFFQLEDLHPGDAVDGSMRIRLGQDILFPFLRDMSEGIGPLQSYLKYVSDTYLGSLHGVNSQSNVTKNQVASSLSRLKLLKGEQRPYADVAVDEFASKSRNGQSSLIAFDALLDRNNFFYQELFEPHITQLARQDDRKLSRIPLFLSATDVRVFGLGRALWEAGREATGLALSSELMNLLVGLGYFHLYMPDVGSLRTDYDLDPNTKHLGDIFAVIGQGGSFTMGCERELVFQGPVFDEPGAEEPFKTLGDRFYNASRLELYDTGFLSVERTQAELRTWDEFATDQSKRISRISESCLSPLEAREVLIRLGVIDNQVAGAGFPESDLERTLRSILKGERLRPGNVRSAVAAVTNSGLFRPLAGGQLTMRSKVFASWLVSDGVFRALQALCYQSDEAPLDRALEIANLPASILRWALTRNQKTLVDDVRKSIPSYLSRHQFRDGGEQTPATLTENLWSLLLAIAANIHARDGKLKGPEVISRFYLQNVKFRSLALPQACFSGLDLSGWSFEDCRLRNASFLDCILDSVVMKDCLLSGASFERCNFGKGSSLFKSFAGSDVSGAEFEACAGLSELFQVQGNTAERLLERSNWTAARVVFNPGEGDKELNARIETATRIVNEHAATAAGFQAVQMLQSGDNQALEVSWPASAARSFAHAQWQERPVTVRTADVSDGCLTTKNSFVEFLAGSFKHDEGKAPQSGTVWRAVSCLGENLNDQVFIAVDGGGQVWHAHFEDGICIWRILHDLPDTRSLAICKQSNGDVVAALEHAGVSGKLTLATLDYSGAVRGICTVDLPFSGVIGAISWIDAQRAGKSSFELLIGPQTGGVFVLFHNGTQWQAASFLGDLTLVSINSFGYAPRENIAIACAQGGRVLGYRNVEAGRMEPLFSFHTAHEWFADVALLNHQGQMLIAGLTAGELRDKPTTMERNVLWALVQPYGNVVTIVSRPPVKGQIEPPIRLRPDSDSGKSALNIVQDARIKDVTRYLDSLLQDRRSIPVVPLLDKKVEFLLKSPERFDARFRLPESIDDKVGNRFRTIGLIVKGIMPDHPSQEFERYYSEAEMDDISVSNTQLSIRCTLDFHRNAKVQRARLIVCYPSSDETRDIERHWDFELQIEWEDNPFVASGVPVSGSQFFGLENEVKEVSNALLLQSDVIVKSCRRAGKSSFIEKVAQQLRSSEKSRIAVVVSGDVIAKDDNIFPSLNAYLRKIGDLEHKSDYLELAELELPSNKMFESFKLLAEGAFRRGYEPPFTVFVDEWGCIKDDIGYSLANEAHNLRRIGVVLCLTSTPGDFRTADTISQSHDYRFFDRKLDIGRLQVDALKSLIVQPLEQRAIEYDEDVIQTVMHLSSGAPHDANILMYYTLNAAKQESASLPRGNGPSGGLHIRMHHLLPAKGKPATEALQHLEEKYIDLQTFLIGALKPEEKAIVLSLAGEDSDPTVEEPNPPPTARWDIEPMGIPLKGGDGDEWRSVFAEAGYRVALVDGEKTDNGVTPGANGYKLWIPWGMTQYYRRLRRTMGGL